MENLVKPLPVMEPNAPTDKPHPPAGAAPRRVAVLSSLVAGDAVGGGATSSVLAHAGIEPALAPTVVFGRHPGRGRPGGGPVPDAAFAGALDGLAAAGRGFDAVLTGYFASPAQVEAAARFLDARRATDPGLLVMVDPICGDGPADANPSGLYVGAEIAEAIRTHLTPRADILTPNLFELSWLAVRPIGDAEDAVRAARGLRPDAAWLVTSAPAGPGRTAALAVEREDARLVSAPALERAPKGTGDLFAAAALIAALDGADPGEAARRAADRVAAALAAASAAGRDALDLFAPADRPYRRPVRVGARGPAFVMGLDGAPGGWAAVLIDLNGLEAPRRALYGSLAEALVAPEAAKVIAVDMPIGFEDQPSGPGGRACERLARARLGPRRSSVFSAPLRPALAAPSYAAALAANRAAGGPGLSKQAWNLFAKLREVDAVMTPRLEGCVHESHPELVFAVLSGAPLAARKATPEGRAERLAILEAAGLPRDLFEPHPFPRTKARPDDLVDAGALALAAARIAEGRALSLPDDPPRDGRGLRMAIFA